MHPHDGGQGPHGLAEGSLAMIPFFGTFLLLVLVASLAALYLWRQGRLPLLGLAGSPAPEDEAKRILAERFARGDISSDDFMERASILNWTPGSQPVPVRMRNPRR